MVITLTITASHDGDMDANFHPREGDKRCYLRAWSQVLCLCETLSLQGQCPPAPNSSDLAPGWHTEGNISFPLGLGWGLSMCVLSMREVGALFCRCGDCLQDFPVRFLPHQTSLSSQQWPRRGGGPLASKGWFVWRRAGVRHRKQRKGLKWEALLITWGQMVYSRLLGTLCPK